MRCNWRRWLWGIISLLMLCWVAVQTEHGRLEQDLAERARGVLAQGGVGWAEASFEGRDGQLTGRAPESADQAKAERALRNLWGVRMVDNKTALVEKVEKYIWSAGRRGNRIRLRGYVPNLAARQAILGVTKASFPGFEVVDNMTIARGVPSQDTWLVGAGFALKQLASLKRGDVRLEDLGLAVMGEAEDVAGYRAVKSAIANNTPKGIKIIADLVTPPVISPYVWKADMADARLNLSGYAPSDSARADLLAAAKASLPAVATIDKMEPGDGAPQGWSAATSAAVRVFGRLDGAGADLKDSVLSVFGTTADEAAAEAARAMVRAALPASIKFSDHIRAKEASPPPQPVERAPESPRTEASTPSPAAPAGAPAPSAALSAPRAAAAPPLPAAIPPPPTVAIGPIPLPPAAPAAEPPTAAPSPKTAASRPPPAAIPPPPTVAIAPIPLPPHGPPPAAATPRAPVPPSPPTASTRPSQREAATVAKTTACKDELSAAAKAGQIRFRYGSAELNGASLETLDKLAEAVKQCPGMRIVVGGHASPEGSAPHNQRLSVRRAQSVAAYLVHAGVDTKQLESVGYGSSRPAVPNTTSENMAKNRRIEFNIRPR